MNRLHILVAAAGIALTGCTATQVSKGLATAQEVVADGQLVCQVGPTALAMLTPQVAAILAKGAAKSAVDTTCGIINGVATALPDVSVQPAGAVVQLPPTVTIPLKT